MQPDELAACYPYLHHAAEGGSWPTIRRLGLLTTEQLVEACDLDPARREAVLGRRRPTSCRLEHPEHGTVVVRDQGPLRERHLDAALVGVTVPEWLHERRLATFLAAYRDRVHDVLVVDTAELVARHHDRVRLAAINTGATIFPNSAKRGRDTFRTIEDFPFDARRRTRQLHDNAVELAVTGGVPDVADLVLRVERRRGPDRTAVLWERDVRRAPGPVPPPLGPRTG